jgi:hypothetical protein
MNTTLVISMIAVFITDGLYGQDSLQYSYRYPEGISIGFGMGGYAVKDEYISSEKYAGTLPSYSVEWVRFHQKGGFRLNFEYCRSNNIMNNNISAEVQQLVFRQDLIYPVCSFSLFSDNVDAYLGPSVHFFVYDIRFNFVQPGTFISPKTFGISGSLGMNTEFIYHLGTDLYIEGLLRSNLVSFTGKKIDEQKYENEPSPTLLSVFTVSNLDFNLTLRYYLANRISICLGYKFNLSSINKWDPFIAASNNLVISLHFML